MLGVKVLSSLLVLCRFSDGAVHAKPPLKSVSVPGPRKPKSLFGSGGFGKFVCVG